MKKREYFLCKRSIVGAMFEGREFFKRAISPEDVLLEFEWESIQFFIAQIDYENICVVKKTGFTAMPPLCQFEEPDDLACDVVLAASYYGAEKIKKWIADEVKIARAAKWEN